MSTQRLSMQDWPRGHCEDDRHAAGAVPQSQAASQSTPIALSEITS
jgi:hypothetical protein